VPVVVYSLLRLALYAVSAAALVLAGMGPLFALLIAVVPAALLSYLLLPGPRDRAAGWLQARSQARGDRPRLSRRAAEDAAVEDAAAEEAAAADQADAVVRGSDDAPGASGR
jgi:hypothetical protein